MREITLRLFQLFGVGGLAMGGPMSWLGVFNRRKTRAVPCTIVRLQCAGRETIADHMDPQQAFDIFAGFMSFVRLRTERNDGIVSFWDIGDLVAAFPEDANPSCRLVGCRVAREIVEAVPGIFDKTRFDFPPESSIVPAVGIDFGQAVFAPAKDCAASGAVVSGASHLLGIAKRRKIPIVVRGTISREVGADYECIKVADEDDVYELGRELR